MSVLTTGISALTAFREQLKTTSHNVANVNTEGYSRQMVSLSTLPAQQTSVGFIGNGVQVAQISRQFDQYLLDRVRVHTSSNEDYAVYLDRASRVDDIIADPDAGLSTAMQDFFDSVQDVADDPSSTATREVMLSSANILADRFQSIHDFLEGMRSEINQDIEILVSEANTMAESIAEINHDIQLAFGQYGSNLPNDLLDERDRLITELSELVNATAVEQSDGSVNVFIGSGQGLVIGAQSFALGTTVNAAEPDRLDVTMTSGGGNTNIITDFLSGGKIGGYFRFRDNLLDPTENALGRLAMGLGTFYNNQHQLGMDLNGALGIDMFTVPDPTDVTDVYGQQMLLAVQGTASMTAVNVSELTTADYELTTLDGTNWVLTNRLTGQITNPVPAAGIISFDGANNNAISIDVTGAAAGDTYIIRPTRLAARAFDVEVTSASQIAAASPISIGEGARVVVPTGANTGTGVVSDSGLTSRTGNTLLAAPVTLTFDSANNWFDISTGGTVAYNPATDSGNELTVAIAGLGNFSFTMTGTPSNSDVFTLSSNSNNAGGDIGIGDNRNMRVLADLQQAKTMINNTSGNATTSFTGLYSSLVGDVGSKTRQASINNETQIRLKEQAVSSYDAVSGVNLDEEAANLVHFQQAYQAASQVIRVSNSLFDALLNAVG
ncbi:MAG: flagellar hook-associated protein FlgK [Chromatiales bacterium]|jgi:flagellar hook-associated protein 1 FlgK